MKYLISVAQAKLLEITLDMMKTFEGKRVLSVCLYT